MDGKKGSLDGNGYVINAWQTLKIPGWRLDNDDVAKFIFGAIGGSYAAKKGETRDVGVIGCAIFQEDRPAHIIVPSTLTYTDYPAAYPATSRTRTTGLGGKKGSGPLRSRGITPVSYTHLTLPTTPYV